MRPALLLALLLVACAPRGLAPASGWQSPLLRDHPAVGRVWDVVVGAWSDPKQMDDALARADVVLLGETHDNADHHLLQAARVVSLVVRGRRPALAFEMLDAPDQSVVDAADSPEALENAVKWADSGWPPFEMYRPIFEAGYGARLPIVAADLSNGEAQSIARGGELPEDLRLELESAPLKAEQLESWRQEMRDSHCGMLPERAVDPMVRAQRARDLRLARRLMSAGPGGAVLIAGAGHVRRDRAVPAWIVRLAPSTKVAAVGFVEVSARVPHPERELWPYDYVVFTPRVDRPDPCASFHMR